VGVVRSEDAQYKGSSVARLFHGGEREDGGANPSRLAEEDRNAIRVKAIGDARWISCTAHSPKGQISGVR
jgi:hypothetical protein